MIDELELVEKKITGDWFELKEVCDDPFKLEEYFALGATEIEALIEAIRLSVDGGILEHKRRTLSRLAAFLEGQERDSRAFSEIAGQIEGMRGITYVSLMQRLVALGTIARRKAQVTATVENPTTGIELKEILAEVDARLAKDAELRKNANVKNILMQASIYRKEVEDLKALGPKIPKEKLGAFQENFKKRFQEITTRIQELWAAFLAEHDRAKEALTSKPLFERFDVKPLGPLFLAQGKAFARIHSILAFAAKERYQTRAILAMIGGERDAVVSLAEREARDYERVAFGHGKRSGPS